MKNSKKLLAGFMAVFLFSAGPAQAQESESDLNAQIESLTDTIEQMQERLSDLQGDSTENTENTGNASVDYTFTSNLSTGDQGVDVLRLQQALNADVDTRVAVTGVGAPGEETNYYGSLTANAVTRFQEKYAADVLTPVGLTAGTGYFGPSTRAKMNTLLSDGLTDENDLPEPPETPDETDENAANEKPDPDELSVEEKFDLAVSQLEGEGDFSDYELRSSADDEMSEGQSGEIFEANVEIEGGDLLLSRVDFVVSNGREDPWDSFETVTLAINGEEVRTQPVNTRDYWRDQEDVTALQELGAQSVGIFTLQEGDEVWGSRFPKIGKILEEDEDYTFTISFEAQNNVDDIPAEWKILVDNEGLRALTSADYNVYAGDQGPSGIEVFTIQDEGDEDEFNVESSSDDPDARTIEVDDDDTTDDEHIFSFTLSADDSESDIEIDKLPVIIELDENGSADLEDVVDDYTLEIDGEAFDDYDVIDADEDDFGSDDTRVVVFDIDDEYTLDAGEEVDVELHVDLESMDEGNEYPQGTELSARVDSDDTDEGNFTNITGEGGDDVIADGSADGDVHTLRSAGTYANTANTEAETSGENDTTGVFTFEFPLQSFEDDFYIKQDGNDFSFEVDGNGANVSSQSVRIPGADREEINGTDYFVISDGEQEEVRVTASISPGAGEAGLYSVRLDETLFYDEEENAETYRFTPEENYETQAVQINN